MRALGFGMAAGLLLAAGCMTVGQDFPVEQVRTLRMGETTQAQIRERFGEPWRTGLDDGRKTWTYARYRYSVIGPTHTRDLVVTFDERGRVVSYTFNSTYPEDRDL